MKRWSSVLFLAVLTFGVVLGWSSGARSIAAQDNRSLAVEVSFNWSGGKDGSACGLDEALSAEIHPRTRQVVVTDATGVIVGKVDLYNALSTDLPTDEDRPGKVESGMCFVRSTIEIPDSDFYTFTIRGEFEWTMSRAELEERGWEMPVYFVAGD